MTTTLYQPLHFCGRVARDLAVARHVVTIDRETGKRRRELRIVGRTVSCNPCGAAESYPVKPGRRVER